MVLEMGALGLLAGGCVTLAFADLAEPGRDQAGYKFQLDPWRLDALWLQVALGYVLPWKEEGGITDLAL
jgi:hypothetical protein